MRDFKKVDFLKMDMDEKSKKLINKQIYNLFTKGLIYITGENKIESLDLENNNNNIK